MSNRLTEMDLRNSDYQGFLSDRIDPASKPQQVGRVEPLPKVRTIALNRGAAPHLVWGSRSKNESNQFKNK